MQNRDHPDEKEYALDPLAPTFVAKIVAARLQGADVNQELKRHEAVLAAVRAGDLSKFEQYLAEQAMLLNYMSADVLALASASRSIATKSALMSMGLKSQAACRKTILALNEMKNPKRTATFIKNQQNNLITRNLDDGRADLDDRAAGITASKNPAVEAVDIEHGAEKLVRQRN